MRDGTLLEKIIYTVADKTSSAEVTFWGGTLPQHWTMVQYEQHLSEGI